MPPSLYEKILRATLDARVYEVAHESEYARASLLSARLGCHVWLKREDRQPTFCYKIRGAHNRMVQLSRAELARGVVTASSGNHAQGVALSAQHLNCKATIFMPTTTL